MTHPLLIMRPQRVPSGQTTIITHPLMTHPLLIMRPTKGSIRWENNHNTPSKNIASDDTSSHDTCSHDTPSHNMNEIRSHCIPPPLTHSFTHTRPCRSVCQTAMYSGLIYEKSLSEPYHQMVTWNKNINKLTSSTIILLMNQ